MNPLTKAFTEASENLGIVFEPTFRLPLANGRYLKTHGLVRNFGTALGTLLFTEQTAPSQTEQHAIAASGYYISVLFPSYFQYLESNFKATLDDWGYFGPEVDRPSWYTGMAWGASK